ncbi:MAG TPA: MFS transporter [Candidatus Limnocylindrales bacterium]|nr:MFS transporter [Candidatus Limnocylindrales bacterium]
MSPALLSRRLQSLAHAGVIDRHEDGSRVTYMLTGDPALVEALAVRRRPAPRVADTIPGPGGHRLTRPASNRAPDPTPIPSPARSLAASIAVTAVVALPSLLVGGLAVLIQQDLDFGEAELGIAIAASFATGACIAVPAGRMAERIGPRRTTWLGLTFAFVALLGIGLVARSWPILVLFLIFAGAGVTTVQLGLNVLLARAVPPRRQGLAFGTKQAAVPFASLLAGLALPVIGLTVGWQVAFVLGAVLVPVVALGLPDAAPARLRADGPTDGSAPLAGLVLLMVGVALASAGGNSAPAFTVASAVNHGVEPSVAGLILAFGSLVGILVRVTAGWVGDRLGRGSLLLVVALIGVGSIAYVGLALTDHPVLIAIFTALAFGGGWGWGGLILLALTRTSPTAPGRAMGIVQVGPMTGAVLGPLVFGTLAEQVSFTAAWGAMALLALLGFATILVSRAVLTRARQVVPVPSVR